MRCIVHGWPLSVKSDSCLKFAARLDYLRAMQRYKNYPIHVTAAHQHGGGGWKAQGVVLDAETSTRELKRVDTAESIFLDDRTEAEGMALLLCRAWIDGLTE